MNPILHKVSNNIRLLREMMNFTREQMAADIDMSLSGYGKMERGEVDITVTRLYEIADVLGVSPEVILNFDPGAMIKEMNHTVKEKAPAAAPPQQGNGLGEFLINHYLQSRKGLQKDSE
jgi:transcriptional regulator with XRE-family HTH domain